MTETQDDINQREWEQQVNWSGWFGSYSSPRDTRLWVPKRPMTGTGQALNFAHPQAKVFLAGMCIVPGAVLVLIAILLLAR